MYQSFDTQYAFGSLSISTLHLIIKIYKTLLDELVTVVIKLLVFIAQPTSMVSCVLTVGDLNRKK